MEPIRIPRVEYVGRCYILDGQIIDNEQIIYGSQSAEDTQITDGSSIQQGVRIVNVDQIAPAQNYLFSTNYNGASGLIGFESVNLGTSSNQVITLDSSTYMTVSDLNTSSSANTSNNPDDTDGDNSSMTLTNDVGYRSPGNNGLAEDVELQLDLPPEFSDLENFVCPNMSDMPNLDINNFDLGAIDLVNEGNFPGLDFGNGNLSQESVFDLINNTANSNTVQQPANTASGAVPRITIRTKKIRKPSKKVKEEPVLDTISTTSYPPLEMLGISSPNTTQASNDTFEYNNPIPCISPFYPEDSLSFYSSPVSPSTSYSSPASPSTSYNTPVSPSTSYSSPASPSTSYNSPVSPSTSTYSYGSPSSPSTEGNPRRSRVNLVTMTDAQRYKHIREQNNESSRVYRERKKMNLKETEAELLLLQERNTRLKEVFEVLKQKKDIAHHLMKGFIKDTSNHNNM